jgi:hypothetical protein
MVRCGGELPSAKRYRHLRLRTVPAAPRNECERFWKATLPSIGCNGSSVIDGSLQSPQCVACDERDQLIRIYLEACIRVADAGKAIPDMKSAEWREATKAARAACKATLTNLSRHRKEHGC